MVLQGHRPIRTCVVCGRKKPKGELLRLGLDSMNSVVLDLKQQMPGRGSYVCAEPNCLQRLRFNKRIQKTFRGKARCLAEEHIRQLLGWPTSLASLEEMTNQALMSTYQVASDIYQQRG
jgi:uncharacterized protein